MARICYSTKPLKRFYQYRTSDNIVYNILSVRPNTIATDGSYWYCYFDVNPYCKASDNNFYPIYKKEGNEAYYHKVYSGDYIFGTETYYYYNGTEYTEMTDAYYYSSNGQNKFPFPNKAKELPYVKMDISYKDEEGVVSSTSTYVYYFDPLIENGDKYDGTSFVARDRDGKTGTVTTYGTLLNDVVFEAVSLTDFVYTVSLLPEYLLPDTASTENPSRTSSFYNMGTGTGSYVPVDVRLYGTLFIEKLNAYMKEEGDKIVAQYERTESTKAYDTIVITTEVNSATGIPIGTITNTPTNKTI